MRLIGLCGRAGAGKDTTADIIAAFAPRTVRFAWADALRRECANAWSVDVSLFMDRGLRNAPLQQLAHDRCRDDGWRDYAWELQSLDRLKPRTVMQRWGDYRRWQNVDYWLAPFWDEHARATAAGAPVMVVTDCRFTNEVRQLRAAGGELWRIRRTGLEPVNSHVSEWAIEHVEADAEIVNDSDTDQLRRTVVDLLTGITV